MMSLMALTELVMGLECMLSLTIQEIVLVMRLECMMALMALTELVMGLECMWSLMIQEIVLVMA
jgi:hypothetical protein